MKISVILISLLLLLSCKEIKTNNPTTAYRYWAGTNPPEQITLEKGQFWESAHWTSEYRLYLKFKSEDKWWNAYILQNKLEVDTTTWEPSNEFPDWFLPSTHSVKYKEFSEYDQGSVYLRDSITGETYIYEIQL